MGGLIFRGLLTLLAGGVFSFSNSLVSGTGRVMSGEVAVHQFDNSDASYIVSQAMTAHMTNWHLPGILLFLVILAIWWGPLVKLFRAMKENVDA